MKAVARFWSYTCGDQGESSFETPASRHEILRGLWPKVVAANTTMTLSTCFGQKLKIWRCDATRFQTRPHFTTINFATDLASLLAHAVYTSKVVFAKGLSSNGASLLKQHMHPPEAAHTSCTRVLSATASHISRTLSSPANPT